MKVVGKVDRHFVYFTAVSYILWPFGNFLDILVYFSHFVMLYQEKSGNAVSKPNVTAMCHFQHKWQQSNLPICVL
jgi:hypothetical protein